jgi:sirohydrochlorin ferrochelatase
MTKNNTFLLLVAHGSRRQSSNDEIRCLAKQLKAMDHAFAKIDCAFLEIAEPSIQQALLGFVAGGARDILVLPYFLSAGRHVAIDIPEQVQQVKIQFPEVKIEIATYLGASKNIAEMVLQQAIEGMV